ncbi:DgyrCDS2126 [Dimorphilus gyrociliatus]|uniref:DgyrCDS2126 n=1 Tax=Dimorphilus gyrociliatus TaxID=2664684 RepID=A0A7I8V9J6_9ANNE|nr:DgyrCDS2126 [Dimorphilus gyrociliatus]
MVKKKAAAKNAVPLPPVVNQQPIIASNTLPMGFVPVPAPPTEASEANIDLGDEHLHVARADVLNGHATPIYAVPQPIILPPGGTVKSTAASEHILARPSVPVQPTPPAHSVVGVPTNIQIGKHHPLAKCRVLYLGSAVPLETTNGLEAVQQPLRERYPVGEGEMKGIDTWLTVFSSGLLMQFVEDKSNITWFPIPTLHVCAAVKAVIVVNGATGEKQAKFVSLDSQGVNTGHPPVFASIMRRMKGIKVLECHGFITKSDQAAMSLVQACTHAYSHKEGWTTELPPLDLMMRLDNNGPVSPRFNTTRLIKADEIDSRKENPEFYEQPPEHGYFYANGDKLIRNFNIYNGGKPTYDDDDDNRHRRQRSVSPVKQRHHNYDPRFVSPPPRYTSKPREEYPEDRRRRRHARDDGRRDNRRRRDKSRDELEHGRSHSRNAHYRDDRDHRDDRDDRTENRRRRNHSRDRLDDVSPDRQVENTTRREREYPKERDNRRYPDENRDRRRMEYSRDPPEDKRGRNQRQFGNNRSDSRERRHRSRDRLEDERNRFQNMTVDDGRQADLYQSRDRRRIPPNRQQDNEVEDYLNEDLNRNDRRREDEDYYNVENQKRQEDEDYLSPTKRQEKHFEAPRPPTPPDNDIFPKEDYDDIIEPAIPLAESADQGRTFGDLDLETTLGYLP